MGAGLLRRPDAPHHGGASLVKSKPKKRTVSKPKAAKKKTHVPKRAVKKPVNAAKSAARKPVARFKMKGKKTARPLKKGTSRKTPAKKQAKAAKRPNRAREREKAREALVQRLATGSASEEAERKPLPKYPILPWADSEGVHALLPHLREAVRKRTISDWRINFAHTRSANLYLGTDLSLEDDQRSIREDILLTVYRRFDDGTMGEAQVPISTTDADTIRREIARAADLAGVTRKTAYDLPEPVEGIHFPNGHDHNVLEAFQSGDGGRIPRRVLDELRAQLAPIRDVRLANAEVLTSASAVRIINSRGVDVSFYRTALLLDLTFLAKSKTDEQEFHWMVDVASPDQFDLRSTVPREAQRARDALAAVPCTGFTGGVLLAGEALRDYITPSNAANPVVMHAYARLKTMGLSRLTPGSRIGEFKGDPFTLSSNPHIPLGALSIPVDEEGTPLRPLDIVRLGTFQQWIAGPRYARELGVPVTGNVANVQVAAGATREDYLRGNRYLEIVSFSWFNPDVVSGDYSAEIRLGYLWENGRATPFRGGHLVGNVFADLCDARLSREVMQAGRYYGPRAILLRNGNVTRSG